MFHRQQQTAQVALEQVRRQARFLGGPFDEAATFQVPAQVKLVKVEQVRPLARHAQAQGDFKCVGAEGFFQSAHPVFPAFQVEEPSLAARLQSGYA